MHVLVVELLMGDIGSIEGLTIHTCNKSLPLGFVE